MIYYNRTNENLPLIRLSRIGITLYLLGMVRVYKDGDSWGAHFRIYHPFNLLLFLIFCFCCLFSNTSVQGLFKEMFYFNNYWRGKKDELEYFKLRYLKYYKKEKIL